MAESKTARELEAILARTPADAVALRAHGLEKQDQRLLRRQIWTTFYRRPAWFVFPPRMTPAPVTENTAATPVP